MSNNSIGEIMKSKSKDIDPIVSEVSIFKQLINERVHSLDLVRELLSNSGAKQVEAKRIEISYTKDKDGHIFEVSDDGCGMNFTGDVRYPGRLDKFLGLGLSGIIGLEHDEFSWKGLGSKLSFQSRIIQIETCRGAGSPFYDVRINEPWETIKNNNVPKPRINEHPSGRKGTKIRVIGHPPHRTDEPFSFMDIQRFLLHRTFAGYTKSRSSHPEISLSVLGQTELILFGFPEIRGIDFDKFSDNGLLLDEKMQTLFIYMRPKKSKAINVTVKGFITWDAHKYQLNNDNLNTGLILSVRGIPYFRLNMEDFGVTTIRTARPGEHKTCLIVECDSIQDEMNISRSGLVDSEKTVEFKKVVAEIFNRIETSEDYLLFRRIPEREKVELQSDVLAEQKTKIKSKDQNWVVYEKSGEITVLIREPQNEQEVNALMWKLEAMGALPFEMFRTLAYIGASKGPDILADFQEEKGSEPQLATVIEIENNFYNYKTHGHAPIQYPKVLCWDIPASGRKVKLTRTSKKHKWTLTTEDYQVHIYVLKLMENIKLMSAEEIEKFSNITKQLT